MRDNLLLSDPKAIGIRCEGLRMRSRHTSRSVAPIGIFRHKSALQSMSLQEGTVKTSSCHGSLLCQTFQPESLELGDFLLCRTFRTLRVDSLSFDRTLLPQACRTIPTLEVDGSDGILLCRTFQTLEQLGVDGLLLCRTLDGYAVSSA